MRSSTPPAVFVKKSFNFVPPFNYAFIQRAVKSAASPLQGPDHAASTQKSTGLMPSACHVRGDPG